MRNQTSFRLTTTLLPTDTTAKTTTVINKVDSNGDKFYPTFTEETVVLTNDDRTVMETTRATCTNGVLTFVKRGLSDDNTATEITNRKLTWNPGTLAFITAGASDMIDVDDDLTRTGNQTYTGNATYSGMLTTAKGVKYPNFADVEALEAYSSPYGGMFATVDDTGELYRYNAVTEQWDLVSTVEISQYIIRADDDRPAPGTADNIITIVEGDQNGEIFLGDRMIANGSYCVDAVVVGGGGGAGSCDSKAGGGAGAVIYREGAAIQKTNCIIVGSGGATGCIGGASSLGKIVAGGGGGGGVSYPAECNGSGGGGAYLSSVSDHDEYLYHGMYGNAGTKNFTCQIGQGYTTHYGNGGGAGGSPAGIQTIRGGEPNKINFNNGQYESFGGGGGGVCCYVYTGPNPEYCHTDGGCYDYCGSGGKGIHDGAGCTGKDGVVQVMYPADGSYGFTCATGGNCCYCCNGYCVHRFTADGTFTVCY